MTKTTVRMAGLTALLCCLAGLAMPQAALAASGLALAPGDPAPKMVAWTLDGELQIMEWQGLTLLNFWATWCEACRLEMPELQKMQEAFGEKGFRVFGLNREPISSDEVRTFLEGTGVQYPQLKPDARLAKGWTGINVLPTSYLINAEGKILRKYVGASTQQIEGLRNDIENLVHGRPMGSMVLGKPEVTQTKTY